MMTSQRKLLLLERLKTDGNVLAKSLALELGVSEDTIRRDLRELASEGKLQRVHGGALPNSPATGDMAVRKALANDEKSRLGQACAKLIRQGQIVIVDGGTTTLAMVQCIAKDLKATIVTHSPSIACALENHPSLDVIMLGGKLFKHSMVSVGAITLAAAKQINADAYFMGVTGIHPSAGLTTGDFEEAQIKRALHLQAAETIVMASSEKIGTASAFEIASITAATQVVYCADKQTPQQHHCIDAMAKLGVGAIAV
jgi:DeoR/GlpR family transcriptional regulator of sugar metabolism